MWRTWVFAIAAAWSIGAASADAPRLPSGVAPTAYDLQLTIDPRSRSFTGEARISVTLAKPAREIMLNGRDLRVTETRLVLANGNTIAGTYREDAKSPGWAAVTLASEAPAGAAVLTLVYEAPFSRERNGLYRLTENKETYAFSQMEPIAARRVFPGFDDPRFKTPYAVSVVTNAADVAVANGPLARRETLGDGRLRHVFAQTELLPTYLIAFAVGPFDIVEAKPLPKTALRAREVPLRGIALKGKAHRFAKALAVTRPFIEWFENYFAAPYPYAKLDLIAEPGKPGAMENAGAITYGERYILVTAETTDEELRAVAEVHAHELAHQWFGNLVTPAWWDDIWLNESFATWMSYRAAAAVMPELGIDREIRALTSAALASDAWRTAKPVRRPLRTDADIGAVFDFATYSKGAAVITMMEHYVGAERFREGLRAHIRRFANGNTTSRDFFASLEQTIGDKQIGAIFETFIDQSGAPVVTGALTCSAEPRLDASQAAYAPLGWAPPERRWKIPLCAQDQDGGRACMALTEREAVLPLAAKTCPKLVALNGGTGYFHQAHDAAGWTALAAHLDTLAPDEQIAAVDSARAAFASGALAPPSFLDVLAKAAKTSDARLLGVTVGQVQALEPALPDGTGDAYQSWVRAVLTPVLARVAKANDLALNKALTRALAVNGRDVSLRGRLSEAGRAMMNGESGGSTPPRPLALRVAVEDGGPDVFATLLKNAKASDDVLFRLEALAALGHAPRAEDRAAFAESLKSFEAYENVLTIYELSTEPSSSVFAWELAKANFERLRGLSASLSANYPILARNLCTAQGRADVQAFVAANAKKMEGHEATLAQTVDEIDHCVALKAGQGAPLAEALKAKGMAVAARRRLRDVDALFAGFAGPPKASAPLDIVAACGRKFPDPSPLAICAATPVPKACSDVRIMLEQCLAARPLE